MLGLDAEDKLESWLEVVLSGVLSVILGGVLGRGF